MRKYNNVIITPHGIARAAWIGVVVGMLLYFSYHLWTLFAPPFLALEPKYDIIINEDFVLLSGATQKDSNIFINGREVAVTKEGAFQERIALQNGMNALEIKSVNKFGKATVIVRRIIKN